MVWHGADAAVSVLRRLISINVASERIRRNIMRQIKAASAERLMVAGSGGYSSMTAHLAGIALWLISRNDGARAA